METTTQDTDWEVNYKEFCEYFPNHPNPEYYPKAFECLVKQWNYRNKRKQELDDESDNQQVLPGE